jgi:DNA processing protein
VNDDRTLLRLSLARSTALRPADRTRLDRALGSARQLLRTPAADAVAITGRGLRPGSWQPERWLRAAEADAQAIARGSLACVEVDGPRYPQQLALAHDPPLLLFFRGALPAWQSPLIGVVGTRRPTGRCRTAAFLLGYEIAGFGLAVVSGLARGIDRLAHEGALQAGGTAVAVLGGGIDRVFPVSSAPVARRILDGGGCLLSEYPPGVPAWRHHFPQRNRVVAGLCRAVIVAQAPQRSGALITADYALEEGRDLYVHACGIDGEQCGGTRDLAESGARVITSAREVLNDWGWALAEGSGGDAAGEPVDDAAGRRSAVGAGLAATMEAELEGRGGEFNGVFFDARGRVVDG